MPRRHWSESPEDSIEPVITGVVLLLVLFLVGQYLTNKAAFARDLAWVIGFIVFAAVLTLVIRVWRDRAHEVRIQGTLDSVKNLGLSDEVKNFIRRFGKDKGTKAETWTFREYKFRNDRLSDLQRILADRGLTLDDEPLRETLERLIQRFSFEETEAGMREAPRPFDSLSGPDFERLLARLYEKTGYVVQLNGRTGDQGADLIATKGGERLVIQAKRYAGSVGNAAVQEVVAAKNHYDGNGAIVITTGDFTREAIDLAKTNRVHLIGKRDLQRLLSEHLGENWN